VPLPEKVVATPIGGRIWAAEYYNITCSVLFSNTVAITSTDQPAGIAGKKFFFGGGAWGRCSEVRGWDVGVYISLIFRKYYYKLWPNAYRHHVTMESAEYYEFPSEFGR